MLDLNSTGRIMGWMGQTTKYSDSQKDLWIRRKKVSCKEWKNWSKD